MSQFWTRGLLLLIFGTIGVVACASEAPPPPQQRADFFPLGVYWPGELTFQEKKLPEQRWQAIDTTLDLLAANHVNAIWLTHVDAKDGAEFARHAEKRGIYLVASIVEISSENPGVRQGDTKAVVKQVLTQWGNAPSPIAWGIGDEPLASYMHELGGMALAWKKAGQPATTVVMPGDAPSAASQLPLSSLCSDIYPYYSPGDPNGPDNHAASTAYIMDGGTGVRRWVQERPGMRYWMMGAIFQDPWGPREVDQDGNVVYLPGGGPHFRMPTPAEVRWETWAALATGAKGVFHFALFYNVGADPTAKALGPDLPFGVKERTESGSPGGMLYRDGRPTPQFTAMGECFGRIAKVGSLLSTLEPTDEHVAFHAKGWPNVGDVVRPFKGRDGSYYVLVVNGNIATDVEIPVNIKGDFGDVTDVITGISVPLSNVERYSWEPVGKPFLQARVKLAPGDGTLLLLHRSKEGAK